MLPAKDLFWSKVNKAGPDQCWLWQAAIANTGYGAIRCKGNTFSSHRLAFIFANGEISRGLSVLHRCDTRACCNPAHLFLGTRRENQLDMKAKGRAGWGGNRLTEAEVREAFAMRSRGIRNRAIAMHFNVGDSLISNLFAGRNYSRWTGIGDGKCLTAES